MTVWWLTLGLGIAADKIVPATDAPKPLVAAESRQRFRLPEGFRIELVAAEPLLAEPTGLCAATVNHARRFAFSTSPSMPDAISR